MPNRCPFLSNKCSDYYSGYYGTIINLQNILKKELLRMAKKKGIPGLTFSWKRALGITKAKRKISKATGIPTTRSGRRAKVGRLFKIK